MPGVLLLVLVACALPVDLPAPPPDQARGEVPAAPAPAASAPTLPAPPVSPPGDGALIEDERNTIAVFRAAAPATVFVTQTQVVVDYWNRRTVEVPAGSGSGFLWDTRGHVVTNYHVVDGGRSYTVTLHDGSEHAARLVGGDPRKDVAVLRIDAPAERLAPVALPPEGHRLEVGQKTIAIGNPFGLDHTLTTGVVSALDREIVGFGEVTIRGMIQTDASINPGNSGGPLLDSSGRLIGMNTMIFSQSGGSAGIGFAVPVATVRRVVEQVIEKGRVEQVGIGVQVLDDRMAQRLGVRGVALLEVAPDSPAAKAGLRGFARTRAGLRMGDVLLKVDGAQVRSFDDLYNALDGRRPGEEVTLTVWRDGQESTVRVPLVVVADGS